MNAGRLIGATPQADLDRSLTEGIVIDYGVCRVRVRSSVSAFGEGLQAVYHAFPLLDEEPFSDFHTAMVHGRGVRAIARPQCRFQVDGIEPFEPFPAVNALPHFEWGVNWCFAQRFNQYVLLHAGVMARGDDAAILAAIPGSGKSTLSAALMLRGWRLLSDEFGVLDPETGQFLAMLKPPSIKNAAIDVIREFSPDVMFGPTFRNTRKGDVAHLAPDYGSVAARHRSARPRIVVFPKYTETASLRVEELTREQGFARLAFNSFNYPLLGPIAFNALADLLEHCPAFELEYDELDDAVECIGELLAGEMGES
jgi:HprK-related kinase A